MNNCSIGHNRFSWWHYCYSSRYKTHTDRSHSLTGGLTNGKKRKTINPISLKRSGGTTPRRQKYSMIWISERR